MCIISRSLCSFFEGQINIESNCFNLFSRIFLKLKEEVPSIFVFSRILGTYFEIYCMRRNQGGLNSIHWGIGEWKTARTSGNGVPGVLGVPVASLTALQNFIPMYYTNQGQWNRGRGGICPDRFWQINYPFSN